MCKQQLDLAEGAGDVLDRDTHVVLAEAYFLLAQCELIASRRTPIDAASAGGDPLISLQ
jgi:hypothetical protein